MFLPKSKLVEQTKEQLAKFKKKKERKARNSRFGEPENIVCIRCGKGPHRGPITLRNVAIDGKKEKVCQNCT
jgi:hypothetical protein